MININAPELTIEDALPCPFCGHSPSDDRTAGAYWVECEQLGCVRPTHHDRYSLANAVAGWNKRIHSDDELSAMVLVKLEEQAKEMGYKNAKEALEALAELRVVLAMAVGDST